MRRPTSLLALAAMLVTAVVVVGVVAGRGARSSVKPPHVAVDDESETFGFDSEARAPARRDAVGSLFVPAGSAATINGTAANETLRGTRGPDIIYGRAGRDRILARAGSDLAVAGEGDDVIFGGAGADRLSTSDDENADRASCGSGRDVITIDWRDRAAADCEVVARRVSRLKPGSQGQIGTEVEPDSFSANGTIVTAFQLGRYSDGAAAIAWATSVDGARTWRSGRLPGVSSTGDRRFSDPVVARDAAHRTWLIASLTADNDLRLLISRSLNGVTWSRPVVAATGSDLDKEWIVCDNWPSSRFRGRCYVSYLNGETGMIETRRSLDGGRTWSAPATAAFTKLTFTSVVNGALPLVRPDGTLILAFVIFTWPHRDQLVVARSTDGGATFEAPVLVSPILDPDVPSVRSAPLPSGDVDAGGNVYLTWNDCRFGADCTGTGIAVASSPDGVTWEAPTVIPAGRRFRGDAFLPALAVEPGTSGRTARLAVTYYFLPECVEVVCRGIDAEIVESRSGGATWGRPQVLSAQPMQLGWIAASPLGRMLGDYISTSWVKGRPVAVLSLASEPHRPTFRQAIFAARVPQGAPLPPAPPRTAR